MAAKGLAGSINLNNINLFFLMLGLLFHWRPWSFLKAAEDAGKAVWGVIIQFPFYAGIFGLFKFTALATAIGNAFVAISNPNTYLLIVYWYSGIENYLIPSGGSKFAITAPYILGAAKTLGVSIPKSCPDLCLGGYDDGYDSAILGDSDAGSGQTRIPRDHGMADARVLCFLYYHVDRFPDLSICVVDIAGDILLMAKYPPRISTSLDDYSSRRAVCPLNLERKTIDLAWACRNFGQVQCFHYEDSGFQQSFVHGSPRVSILFDGKIIRSHQPNFLFHQNMAPSSVKYV